ncbi:MAG: acyl-CoA dehydrogenase protein [Acidimicrobiales bacterium]|nr:acyl-CoA dehydrogenase protein [Acidimicrobiales bacterium]
MDFEFSEEQEALRASVRRFLAEQAPIQPYVRDMLDDDRGATDAVWKGLAQLGLTGLLVPEEHGGAGMGMVDMGVVLEELGRAVHPGPFLSSAVAATTALTASGDGADLLPSLADGSITATVALLEKDGRDWRRVATEAGAGDVLTGTKTFVADGVAADVLLVTGTTEDGLGLFAVEAGARGLDVQPVQSVDGTRKQATVVLDDTPARRIGTGDAAGAVAEAVDRVLVGLVVDGVGAAQAALDLAVAYAKERVQFDKPIGSFQAVQHLCADMLRSLELGRAGAYYALWACDAADEAERHRAAVMAKAFAADTFASLGASAIQVFGGVGFTWEHDVHLFYKRLLTLQQAYGDTSDFLEELATLVV